MRTYRNDIDHILSVRSVRHILFWAGYIMAMTYIHGFGIESGKYWPWFCNYLIELPVLIGLTYLVTYFIIPGWLLRKKYIATIILMLASFLFFSFLNLWLDKLIIKPYFFPNRGDIDPFSAVKIFSNAFGLIFPVVIFVSVTFIKYSSEKTTLEDRRKQKFLKEQLDNVRDRIHPVFLRNSLDDIYTLPSEKSHLLPEMVLKISDILHYLLYECESEKLTLRKEEQAIRTYFAFLKLRYNDHFDYDILIQSPLENILISPYILFPLTLSLCSFQKAFDEQPGKIFLYINTGDAALDFSASLNMKREILQVNIQENWKEEVKLARRRLDTVYAGKYSLDMMETERKLQLKLTLDLN